MPRTRDILRRFRPAGAPGAASVTGVPVDRAAELAAELQPVLERLAGTQVEAAGIRRDAHAAARARREQAAAEAAALVAQAHRDAPAERAAAALAVTRQTARQSAALRQAAEQEAAAVRSRAAERLPGFVERALGIARAALAEEQQS
ncbi:hypothetical protein [Georgenia satyanarayanai]|uniref:hypothetical protein n=1 Tax=Georgenia satyanarayanai TaxID=860221 RepID=UPI001264CD40|nr:hypothetical protein [Georgenia satyanarayanai]